MRATPEATAAYASRFAAQTQDDFYARSRSDLTLSSVGMGLYKGEVSDSGDDNWAQSIRFGIENGINVYDTAIRYRAMRSEKILGKVLRESFRDGIAKRQEIFVSSKVGMLAIPEDRDREDYVEDELVRRRGVPKEFIYNNLHCLEANFVRGELDISLANLGLDALDAYFLHNPEMTFLTKSGKEGFYQRLPAILEVLEEKVSEGVLGVYGVSSWTGFRRRPDSLFFMDLKRIWDIARSVGGNNHHFRFLQLPLSVGMPFTYTHVKDSAEKPGTIFEMAADLGMDVFASAGLYEGHLEALYTLDRLMKIAGRSDSEKNEGKAEVSLPVSENSIAQLFDLLISLKDEQTPLSERLDALSENRLGPYPSALNLVRSTPGVTAALSGMELLEYAADNLSIVKTNKIPPSKVDEFWRSITPSLAPLKDGAETT